MFLVRFCEGIEKFLISEEFVRMSSANYQQEKPKVVPIIHERPKMPAKTWSALRSHILAERKKKREEEGKQQEEERLKRERESRKKQEANSLEETKDQIVLLEEKLTNLKEEKHQLFLTLKKVLNEDDSRRRKESSEMNSLYGPAPSHASNVLPMSGHVASGSGSRYIHSAGHQASSLQQRGVASMYRAGHQPQHVPKRTRSPSPGPPPVSSYYPPPATSRPVPMYPGAPAPGYMPPLISSQATTATRDLLKEAVSQGLGLTVPGVPAAAHREQLLGGSVAGMSPHDREMFAKGLGAELPPLNLAGGKVAAESQETYARYLSAFQQQLDPGSKTAVAAAALSELDRARLVAISSAGGAQQQPRPGYYSQESLGHRGAFPSSRQ